MFIAIDVIFKVWEDKFSNLERLTPREDFSAWDYRETEKERRRRFKIQGDFERKMMVRGV
jgi:hypothetical protein